MVPASGIASQLELNDGYRRNPTITQKVSTLILPRHKNKPEEVCRVGASWGPKGLMSLSKRWCNMHSNFRPEWVL